MTSLQTSLGPSCTGIRRDRLKLRLHSVLAEELGKLIDAVGDDPGVLSAKSAMFLAEVNTWLGQQDKCAILLMDQTRHSTAQ